MHFETILQHIYSYLYFLTPPQIHVKTQISITLINQHKSNSNSKPCNHILVLCAAGAALQNGCYGFRAQALPPTIRWCLVSPRLLCQAYRRTITKQAVTKSGR